MNNKIVLLEFDFIKNELMSDLSIIQFHSFNNRYYLIIINLKV
jgi:hypothetical protein